MTWRLLLAICSVVAYSASADRVYRAPLFDAAFLRELRLLPTEYLFYYYRPRDAYRNIAAGLRPDLPSGRFVNLGNASLAGAAALLLDPAVRTKTEMWRKIVRHLSPAEDPAYQKIFAAAMRIRKGEKHS